ncbi:MAG: hypothetical protein GY774_13220 [Planctomycetes bacterium]|nr:hypothetical protein [Planctomycetota bacterium]
MGKKNHTPEMRQKLAQRAIFLALISSQLTEIEAIEAIANANVQYHQWTRLSSQRQSGFVKNSL